MPRTWWMAIWFLASAAGCGGRGSAPAGPPSPPELQATLDSLQGARGDLQTIEAGDLLEIVVFQAPELSRPTRVSPEGEVSLPLVGEVPAAGRTPTQLAVELQDRLRGTYMVDPHVNVEFAEARSASVYVLGAVNQPGAFPLPPSERLTVLRALALSEGLRPTAAQGRAVIIRTVEGGARSEIPVDLNRVLAGHSADLPLHPNDVFFVPSSTAKSFARGAVDALVRMITLRGIF